MKRQRSFSTSSCSEAPPGSTYNLRSRIILGPTCCQLGTRSKTPSPLLPKEENVLQTTEEIPDDSVQEIPEGVDKIENIYTDGISLLDVCYIVDNLNFVKTLEKQRSLPKRFLANEKPVVLPRTRALAIDWLIQVQHHLILLQETLYLTVNIIDHYFACTPIIKNKDVQLIIIAALLISCKVEERMRPKIRKLTHLTMDTYSYSAVIEMETTILVALDFNMNFATPLPFVRHCVHVCKGDQTVSTLSYYLIDLILHDVRSTWYSPSMLAASAVYLARKILLKEGSSQWNRTIQYYSGYDETAFKPIVAVMCETLIGLPTSRYRGAGRKYASQSCYQGLSKSTALNPVSIRNLKF